MLHILIKIKALEIIYLIVGYEFGAQNLIENDGFYKKINYEN